MVAAALIVLVKLGRADAIIAFVIIGREITISALREWMAKLGESRVSPFPCWQDQDCLSDDCDNNAAVP